MSKVEITKSILDNLADTLALEARVSTYMTFSQMRAAITGMYASEEYKELVDEFVFKTYSYNYSNSSAKQIPSYAFANLSSIESVSFPAAKTIGECAFINCGISSINIGTITKIGESAFRGCENLTSLSLSKVTSVPSYAFYNCSNLSSITLGNVSDIGSHAFEGCRITSFDQSEAAPTIKEYAFCGCTSLSLFHIGAMGFSWFEDVLDDQCVKYADFIFSGCTSLTSYIQEQIYTISVPKGAFKDCSNLSFISGLNYKYVGEYGFDGCQNYDPASKLNPYAWFSSYAFRSCGITSFNFISSYGTIVDISEIASGAFYDCKSLTTFIVTSSYTSNLKSIGSFAFCSCTSLQTFECGSNIETIEQQAFFDCKNLSSFNFLNCHSIGFMTFYRCSKLGENLDMPMCTYIYDQAFISCTKIKTISAPKLLYIGTEAFLNCSTLSQFYSPKVTTVSTNAFTNCSKLESVSFSKVNGIGEGAFKNCYALSTALFLGGSYIGRSAFENCSQLISLYLLTSSSFSYPTTYIPRLNSYAFRSTPISGGNGNIYVRASLYNSFITHSQWSSYASRIISMTNSEISALLGT